MTIVPKNQPSKNPELYPIPRTTDQIVNHIDEICDAVKHPKRTLRDLIIPKLSKIS